MKRRKPPLTIHTKCIRNLNSSFSRALSENKSVKFEIPVFTQIENMSEKCEEMDVIRKDIVLNSPNSSRLPEDHFSFLSENENNASQFDDSTSQQNLGREWGEEILRSFAVLDQENIEKFVKVKDNLTRYKDSIRSTRSHTFTSNQLASVPTSIRKTKKTYRIISTMQQKRKSMAGILASKKVKIAFKRLRTTGKNRSLRCIKRKQNIQTNNADEPVQSQIFIKNRKSCSNSKSNQNVGEVEEYSRDEEKSEHLLRDSDMKLYQYHRRRGKDESLEKCDIKNHVTSGLAHSFISEACDSKTNSIDANQSYIKNDQETNLILGDLNSKSPLKSLPTDVNIITSNNLKRNDSNTILTFSIDKNRVSPVGVRSKFSHSQKLLRQSKLFLIKRSARSDQEPSHAALSVKRELLQNVENEKCLKRQSERSPSPVENLGTTRETELDALGTIITPEEDKNPSIVSIAEANAKKEKSEKRKRKINTKSSLQEVSVDVDIFFENNKNILRSFPKVDRMKRRGKTCSKQLEPPHFASPRNAGLPPLSRHSTSETSPKIRQNSPSFKKAKRNRSESLREKSIRKCREKTPDDCNVCGDESPEPSSGMIRKAAVNSVYEEVENVCRSNPDVTACSEDKDKISSSCKPEKSCRYFLRKKGNAKTESEILSSTTQPEIKSDVHTLQVLEMKDDPSSYRSANHGENREQFGSEIAKSDFSIKKFPQVLFPPSDSTQQKVCKNTVISKNVEKKTKKKNVRKRKLWSQSSSLDDIQTEVVNKTSSSPHSRKETCRSHVDNEFQSAINHLGTSEGVDSEKEGSVIKKCSLQHVSNPSQKEVDDYTVPPNLRSKIKQLLQQQDTKETRCVASEEASPSRKSIKIQKLNVKQNNTVEKDNVQGNALSSQQNYSEINNYSSPPQFCSGKETDEECISREKGNLKETLNHLATGGEDNPSSYSDETITVSVTPSEIQKGNEKQVLNSNELPNIEQPTPTNIVSTVNISPNLLRSISVKPKIISKNPSASTIKAKNDLSMRKTSDVEENIRSSDTQENFKKIQDTSVHFFEGNRNDSKVKDNLQEYVKTNDEWSMERVHPVSKNAKNWVNKERLLIPPTNMDIVRKSGSSPLKKNLQESHEQSQNTSTHSFDNDVDTVSVPVFPHRSPASKTLMAKQPSVICPTNFKAASEIRKIKVSLNTRSDCKLLNGNGESRELLLMNDDSVATTDCAEPVISPSREEQVHSGSFYVKNVQEVNKSPTDLVHNSLTGSDADNLSIHETKHYSGKDEKYENPVVIMSSQTVSHLPSESRNKCEDQFNYNSDPIQNSRSEVSEYEGNSVSDSRNEELHDVLCRPIDAEIISETSLNDSSKGKTDTSRKQPLILSNSMSMATHNNSVTEKIHNPLCHSTIDSEKKNISRSELISMYSELLENWNRELKEKRNLIFQQNSPGVASCETKTSDMATLNVGNPQDNAFKDSDTPVCAEHKEDNVAPFIRIVTEEGSKTYVIMCLLPEEGEKQTEATQQGLQESTADNSGKEQRAKEPSTSPCEAILTDGENNEKLMKIQNSENAFSESSTVLCEEMQHIPHQTFPIKTQGRAGFVSALFSEINTGETTIPPFPDFTDKCKDYLKSPGKRTNDNESYTTQLKGEESRDKEGRIAQFVSCPNPITAIQQQNYPDGTVITEDPHILTSNTKLSDFSRIALSHTAETFNCLDEEKSHFLKENKEITGNYWEGEVAAPVAMLREDDCTIPSKGKSETTSEGRQSEKFISSNCDRRKTCLQNESRSSAKTVRNQKVIRKNLRSPYMLRGAKRDENCLSLQRRKNRQLKSKLIENQSLTLNDDDKYLQMLSRPSFLLSELTRLVRSPYLLRNRKIKSQFSFLKHSKQLRTVRKVNSHSTSKPIVKSGSNSFGPENNRKIRSPYMLRNDESEKPCNSSITNNKRKILIGNKRKSTSSYPISREHQRHFLSTLLSSVTRISRSPYVHKPERKIYHAKQKFHTRHNQSREVEDEVVLRASQEKIQDVVESQITSGAKVQTNAAEINPCISISKDDEREIVEEGKSFTTSTHSDLDFHISESSDHKSSRNSSDVQKNQRPSLSERTEENSLSSRLPHRMNTILSKVEETLSKSCSLQASSLDLNPRFPIYTEGQIENRVNDLNSDKNIHPKNSEQHVQISSKACALDKNPLQTTLMFEMASKMLLSELPIPVERKISEAEEDHSTFHEEREESFQSTTKEVPKSNTDINCSSLTNCKENNEKFGANKCFKSVNEDNQIPRNSDEGMQEEIPFSFTPPSPTTNNRTQKRERVKNDLHYATRAYLNTSLHSKQKYSGSNILEENNTHSLVNRLGRNKIGFEGSCWLNDELRKLFPLPQCLDESRNRIMSSSTFIWLCLKKKLRESRFPLFKMRERRKSEKMAGKKRRGSTLNTDALEKSQLVSDGGRKEIKSQVNKKKWDEKKEYCSSNYLSNQRQNRMNVKKLVASNEKTNAFLKRQGLQKWGENGNIKSLSVINKRISLESQEHISSSSEGKPVPDTRKKSQKVLHPPVGKVVMIHIVRCRRSSTMKSITPTCQEETLGKKQHCAQSTPAKVKNLKISKKVQKVEPKVMLNESAHSRRQQTLSNKCEESENFPEVLQKSLKCLKKRNPKRAGVSGSHNLGGCSRSTSPPITKVTDSYLSVGNNANEGGKSSMRSFRKHSENYENTKKRKRKERECTSLATEGYQDAVKFLEHMHSISYTAAKMKSKEHFSSSFILTTLVNDLKLQANCCELKNETSMSDKLTTMNPAKKTLTAKKRNDTTILVTSGNTGEKPSIKRGFTLPVDCSKATVAKKRKKKSKQERNASLGSNLKRRTARNEINRSLSSRETTRSTQDGRPPPSPLPSLSSKDTVKRKQRSDRRKSQNQESSNTNSEDMNATKVHPAMYPQPKASLSAEDAKNGSRLSDGASLQGRPLWSPLAWRGAPSSSRLARGAPSSRQRQEDRALDLFSPDDSAIHRAVQRAKRQLAARGPPPPPARGRSRADELTRRLWGRE